MSDTQAMSAPGHDELQWMRALIVKADAIRAAQRAYMADRGDEAKGRAVGEAAAAYDAVRATPIAAPGAFPALSSKMLNGAGVAIRGLTEPEEIVKAVHAAFAEWYVPVAAPGAGAVTEAADVDDRGFIDEMGCEPRAQASNEAIFLIDND